MGNKFWGAARFMEHPCFHPSGEYFCTGCGQQSQTLKEHNDHVMEQHTQAEAYDLLSGNDYDRLFKTPEWQARKAAQAEKRKLVAWARKQGFVKSKIKIFRDTWLRFEDGKVVYYTIAEIEILKNQ